NCLPVSEITYHAVHEKRSITCVERECGQRKSTHPGPVRFPLKPVETFRNFRRTHLEFFHVIESTSVNHPEISDMARSGGSGIFFKRAIKPHEENGCSNPGHSNGN